MAKPKIRSLIPEIPINEQRGSAFAAQLIDYINKHKGQYLRDEAGQLHVILDGSRIPLLNTPDNYALAHLMFAICKVSTLSQPARAAIQRLQVEAAAKADQMQLKSSLRSPLRALACTSHSTAASFFRSPQTPSTARQMGRTKTTSGSSIHAARLCGTQHLIVPRSSPTSRGCWSIHRPAKSRPCAGSWQCTPGCSPTSAIPARRDSCWC